MNLDCMDYLRNRRLSEQKEQTNNPDKSVIMVEASGTAVAFAERFWIT